MLAIYALILRELKRFLRSKIQIVTSLIQPAVCLLVMGFGFDPVYRSSGAGSYLQFLAPGIIAMTVMFTATFSGMTVLWDRQFGFLKGTLVAPVSRIQIAVGRTSGAAIVAVVQGVLVGFVCLAAGFRPQSAAMVPVGLLLLLLTAFVFAALGTMIGATLKKLESFNVAINFLILPIFLLSGAVFPLINLPKTLATLTAVNPLSYGVDGLRATLIGEAHFGLATDITVLALVSVALTSLAAWRVSRIEV